MSVITVKNLTMVYKAFVRESGLKAGVISLFRRKYNEVRAVQDISLELASGEVVGFIGPNGAGKTTTLKVLSGILYPTSGEVRVLGFTPWKREAGLLKQIALIRGSQPIGGPSELTVLDTLRFQQLIYEISDADFRHNLGELTEMLDLSPLLQRQVRALSLGERMRCGLAMSLLYRPRVLFLDEPTLGLDVSAVSMVRRFIGDYTRQTGATVLLTSHYMADVEVLCKRIILIDRGTLRYDGELEALSISRSPFKLLKVTIPEGVSPQWSSFGEVVESENSKVSLRVHRDQIPSVTARILAEMPVIDLAVENPPLENVIDQVYKENVV